MPIDPADPLGINHLLDANRDWSTRYGTGAADTTQMLPIERETVEALQRRHELAHAGVKSGGNCEDRPVEHLTEDDDHD